MHLKPQQVDLVIASGPVRDEFAQKVKELDRRLKMNGMNYQQWDTLTDHQHDIFTDNLFLDGECATSPEDYVRGAVSSCGCPDVAEDLHHHSPVLMREIEKQQEMAPDMTVKISESLSLLNEIIDQQINRLVTESDLLVESNKGCEYEKQVLKAMRAAPPEAVQLGFKHGTIEAGACDDSTGADGDFFIDGERYELEIKLDEYAQMGGTSVRYYPERSNPKERFEFVPPKDLDKDISDVIKDAVLLHLVRTEKDVWRPFVENLITPELKASSKWVGNPDETAAPFVSTYENWQKAFLGGRKVTPGDYKKNKNGEIVLDDNGDPVLKTATSTVNMTGDKAVRVTAAAIHELYARKGIYYIQIGGLGLFHLQSDPANLGVPQLSQEVNFEIRPGKSGSDKVKTEKIGPDGKFIMKPVMVKDKKTGKKVQARHGKGPNKGELRFTPELEVVFEDVLDADGNPIYEKDKKGNIVKDKNGDPVVKRRKKQLLRPAEDGSGKMYVKASGPLRVQARLIKSAKTDTDKVPGEAETPDPYSFDNPASILRMMEDRAKRLNQQSEEEPEVPQEEPEDDFPDYVTGAGDFADNRDDY
jgi:hypothetical protein